MVLCVLLAFLAERRGETDLEGEDEMEADLDEEEVVRVRVRQRDGDDDDDGIITDTASRIHGPLF